MSQIVNLGIVKAIHVGATAPTNLNMLWRDTVNNVHKAYNISTSTWDELVGIVLIDNVTIKRDVDGKIYVDPSTIPSLSIADNSITLVKLADVASGTVFYRKSLGSGVPEVQTLAQLKADLGLTGTNSGDQDLSLYVLKVTTVNGKVLSGNIILTPTDIGSPAGSGTSTGTNTGDETESTILDKLGVVDVISSELLGIVLQYYVEKEIGKSLVSDIEIAKLLTLRQDNYEISLPSSGTVAGRIAGVLVVPPTWSLAVGVSALDLIITHNLNRRVHSVTIWSVDGAQEQQLYNTAANNGIITPDANSIRIQSLATIAKPIKIYINFV